MLTSDRVDRPLDWIHLNAQSLIIADWLIPQQSRSRLARLVTSLTCDNQNSIDSFHGKAAHLAIGPLRLEITRLQHGHGGEESKDPHRDGQSWSRTRMT